MKDKRVLDYTNKSERECFDLWFAECPVDWKKDYTDDDGDDEIQVIGFVVPKESKDD